MNGRILGIVVVIFLGVFFGLIFSATQQSLLLDRMQVAQLGEMKDLLQTMADRHDDLKADTKSILEAAAKVDQLVGRMPSPQKPSRPKEDYTTVYKIPVTDAVMTGPETAPVTIAGFLDLQCPFSKRFQPVIDQVLESYPGQVNYVVKHFPLNFHPQALPAAKAVLAAKRQGKGYQMVEKILENNKALSPEKYLELAKELGLNAEQFQKDLADNDEAWTKLIQADFSLGRDIQVHGTPTYYLNGRKTSARSLEAFQAEIDQILEKK